mmetsp:Transcript_50531/g.152252  ORF Transcript_50531/g.152252 Transcript_50531/m.152252 type:complete len:86 (+) Transcript_50531:94-351(+)
MKEGEGDVNGAWRERERKREREGEGGRERERCQGEGKKRDGGSRARELLRGERGRWRRRVARPFASSALVVSGTEGKRREVLNTY